jgi:DNA primase
MNLEEIKNKLDIVEIVSNYVKLKKVGKYYSGLCPFHKETKPSFYVSPEMQIFKCFGCNVGGDVLKFLMLIENLNYSQLLEKLKNDFGIDVKKETEIKKEEISEIKKIYEINYAALKFFRQKLNQNQEALNYLKERGLNQKTIDYFELGYSPGNTLLKDYLYSQGYDYDLIKKAGLLDYQNFDRFHSRIIFPLRDEKGKLLGFSGRIFPTHLEGAKYINTPETLVFKKSQFLYGLYYSKDYILVEKKVILVEGQFDFLLSWQNNLKNVVAVSGSSLTEDHLRKLKKYTNTIVLAFDNDEAGFKASLRANLLAQQFEFNVLKLIYEGKDLADHFLVKKETKEVPFIDWLLEELKNKYQNKEEILNIFLPQIKNLPPLKLNNYLDILEKSFDIKKNILEQLLKNEKNYDNILKENKSIIFDISTLEDKLSLKLISLIYTFPDLKNEEIYNYLNPKYQELVLKILNNKLEDDEYNYLEMAKNFYTNNKINYKAEFSKVYKNIKIFNLKKKINLIYKSLRENNNLKNFDLENLNKIIKEFKNIYKNE